MLEQQFVGFLGKHRAHGGPGESLAPDPLGD
jgi:hypothetical protein